MSHYSLAIVTFVAYFIGTIFTLSNYPQYQARLRLAWMFGLVAVALHCALLYRFIDMHPGQNLAIFNVVSLVAWLITLIVLLFTPKPCGPLLLLAYPLSALSIGLATYFPKLHILQTSVHPLTLVHILLSLVSVSVLGVASLQALVLEWQAQKLRAGKASTSLSLETMENFLSQTLIVGFILLALSLASGLIFTPDLSDKGLQAKMLLATLAWVVFAAIIAKRTLLKWQGTRSFRGVLPGFGLLLAAYFGTKLFIYLTI